MYVLVYGRGQEDMLFFTDMSKAKYKLYIQTLALSYFPDQTYYPCLIEYYDRLGVLKKTGTSWMIDPDKIGSVQFEDVQLDLQLIDGILQKIQA